MGNMMSVSLTPTEIKKELTIISQTLLLWVQAAGLDTEIANCGAAQPGVSGAVTGSTPLCAVMNSVMQIVMSKGSWTMPKFKTAVSRISSLVSNAIKAGTLPTKDTSGKVLPDYTVFQTTLQQYVQFFAANERVPNYSKTAYANWPSWAKVLLVGGSVVVGLAVIGLITMLAMKKMKKRA